MTLLVTTLLILPIGYILLVSGIEITALINKLQSDFKMGEISRITDEVIMGLPLSDSIREFIDSSLRNNLESIAIAVKDFSIVILKSITTLSSQFIFFVIITIFSLYYFYVDGPSFIEKIKKASPLDKKIDNLLLNQFSGLSLTLVGSVFLVSLTQGVVFAIGVIIVGFPALFFWRRNGSCKLYSCTWWNTSMASVINLFICNRRVGECINHYLFWRNFSRNIN